ncbi:hypothetical protein ACOI1H_07060 [Loktanella sp. DJP18]|uniref:hypothetical protein n=1 Tax=Loktanella sp. DJP18 TaxID=3409788 RepID=UPI003BB6686E
MLLTGGDTTGGLTLRDPASNGNLTVQRTESDVSLTVTDHLLDTRETRFSAGVELEVVAYRKEVYVIASGDDGITVLQLLPGGQMVNCSTIADTTAMTLTNVGGVGNDQLNSG